ncbi:MAG: alpha/beta hydrolase [Pseudomonadota bacterium]
MVGVASTVRLGLSRPLAMLIGLCVLSACSGSEETIGADLRCEVGAYSLDSGALIDIGLLDAEQLRWRTLDGRTGRLKRTAEQPTWSGTVGWTDDPHPARVELGDCADQRIQVAGIEGIDGAGERVTFEITDTRFQGEGVELAGRLVMPVGDEPVPLVVLVHGSEDYSALDYYYDQRQLPAQGIGVFVYDKRGTGQSEGDYSQDFHLLAADAAAAHRTALALAGERAAHSGYSGGSQGGWVAPLAATLSDVDFVVASYGMAEGPLAEDRDEVQLRLRKAGYGAEVLAQAREITDATGRLLASDFEAGADDLQRLRARYQEEPWFAELEGGVTWEMVSRPLWQFRAGYYFLDVGTSWNYEPMSVLRKVDVPMLWVLAGADSSAPPEQTRRRLGELQQGGQPVDVAYFPNTEHGMIRFTETVDGERKELGYASGYFPLLADWIANLRLSAQVPDAELSPRTDA